jgi:DNA segregation ATPase FtsK/SpoIIIE-like protein
LNSKTDEAIAKAMEGGEELSTEKIKEIEQKIKREIATAITDEAIAKAMEGGEELPTEEIKEIEQKIKREIATACIAKNADKKDQIEQYDHLKNIVDTSLKRKRKLVVADVKKEMAELLKKATRVSDATLTDDKIDKYAGHIARVILEKGGAKLSFVDKAKEIGFKIAKKINDRVAKTNTRAEVDKKLNEITRKVGQDKAFTGKKTTNRLFR